MQTFGDRHPALGRNGDGHFRYRDGRWLPWWALLMAPYLVFAVPLYLIVRRAFHWKSAWLTVLVFEALLMPVERYSLGRGHWIYNESRILGPRVMGVPIEEPLLYYLFSPLIIIGIFHAFRRGVARPQPSSRSAT